MSARPLLQALVRGIGALSFIGGTLAVLVFLWAMIDPVGVQMANDADPFATPPSRLHSAYGLAFSLCVAVGGARMASFRTDA